MVAAVHNQDPRSFVQSAVFAAALFVFALADVVVVAAALHGLVPPAIFVVFHVGLIVSFWAITSPSSDATTLVLSLIAMLLAGPIGALGALHLSHVDARRTRSLADNPLAARMSDANPASADGKRDQGYVRTIERPGAQFVQDFELVLDSRNTARIQTMLGLISQHFRAEYTPTLRRALKCDIPAVRVSAAAVFAKLRQEDRKTLLELGPQAALQSKQEAVERAKVLAQVAANRLLDPTDISAIRLEAMQLLREARPVPQAADWVEELLCTLLFECGMFGELENRIQRVGREKSAVLAELWLKVFMPRRNRPSRPPSRTRTLTYDLQASPRDAFATDNETRPT